MKKEFKKGDFVYRVNGYLGISIFEIDLVRKYTSRFDGTEYKYGFKGSDFMFTGDDLYLDKKEAEKILLDNIRTQKEKLTHRYEQELKSLDKVITDNL